MRLKSSIFVSALIRQVGTDGGYGAVLNKGAEEAGAIFIVHARSSNNCDFYGPAPQAFFDDENSGERFFELLNKGLSEQEVSERIASQLKFDPDCWVVELELRGELTGLAILES